MRLWRNNATDDGSLHSLGNGRMGAYGQGPHLVQVFGPPYSSPSLCQLLLDPDCADESRSTREPGAAIWTHQLLLKGEGIGQISDLVDADLPVLVRHAQFARPFRFRLALAAGIETVDIAPSGLPEVGGVLLIAPAGRYLYHTYPFPTPIFHQITWRGPVQAHWSAAGDVLLLECGSGECDLFFAGGPDYPSTQTTSEAAVNTAYLTLLNRTRRSWQAFTARRSDWGASLPVDLPQRAILVQAIDDVAVLIKAQQAAEGAVLAGHSYHMGYVRDQYGVSRGLLALGHLEEAQKILSFYWGIWQRHGRIHNAQAAGVDGVFHIHENDEVEITGYLIQQAFDLLARTGDADFHNTIFPMLVWAWEAQKKHLAAGMLPFNGDETYVAGGILPRNTLNDGSAEATLLFIESGEKLLNWVAQHRLWPDERISENRRVLAATRSDFRENFWAGGRLITNNPGRTSLVSLPRFRHGVCERCQFEGRYKGIQWTERNAFGRYLCPTCLAGPIFPAAPAQVYRLQSVSLTPFYFHARLFTFQELAPLVEEIVQGYQATGRLPSKPEDANGMAVGYDYGLLLYAMCQLNHPLARNLYEKTLSLLDTSGAWVEYYQDHQPRGTRCRPWESAINLEAVLTWSIR